MNKLLFACACTSLVVGCKPKEKPADKPAAGSGSSVAMKVDVTVGSAATPPPATPPPAAGKPFEATFAGKPVTFASVNITNGVTHPVLRLTTDKTGCQQGYTSGDTMLEIDLQPGPGGKYFAPGPFGATAHLTNEVAKYVTSYLDTYVTFEPGEWKAGNKIKGTLSIDAADHSGDKKETYTGSGSFEAEICEMPDTTRNDVYAAAPETVDKGPVTGMVGKGKFTFGGGIALLRKKDNGELAIGEIDLFDAPVDCDSGRHQGKTNKLRLADDGGATSKHNLPGTFQQRNIWLDTPNSGQSQHAGPEWVKLDQIDLKDGGDVKGSLYSATTDYEAKQYPDRVINVAGTFAVKVCKDYDE